jgi:hypothetical protein
MRSMRSMRGGFIFRNRPWLRKTIAPSRLSKRIERLSRLGPMHSSIMSHFCEGHWLRKTIAPSTLSKRIERLSRLYLQRGPPIAENKPTTHRTHRTHRLGPMHTSVMSHWVSWWGHGIPLQGPPITENKPPTHRTHTTGSWSFYAWWFFFPTRTTENFVQQFPHTHGARATDGSLVAQ